MKYSSFLLLLPLFVLAMAQPSHAQQTTALPFSVQIEQKDHLRLAISCQKPAGKKLTLTVKKTDGQLFKSPYVEVIYEERIAETAMEHVRSFDLSQLGEGDYRIEVSDGKQYYNQSVRIGTRYFRPYVQEIELVSK